MPFAFAHVSDLHVSTFGDTFHDRANLVKRSANVADTDPSRWEELWAEAGWRVLRARQGRKLVIVDAEGYAHPPPSKRAIRGLLDPVERAAAQACHQEARRAKTLAADPPSDGALAVLAEATPKNSNVRLLRAARVVEQSGVDAVLITGDLTDDGDGYELVYAAFERFAARGRLFAVPGNHDRYLFPIPGSSRPRPTYASKTAAWRAFAGRLGLDLDASGAWVRFLPEASMAVVGIDTCTRPQRRFFRHNGAVGPEQLAFLGEVAKRAEWKASRHRLVMLHHHVVRLPHGVGKRAPTEIGMRLDDARGAAEAFDAAGVTLVLHGHRHISEERQPAGVGFRLLAAPSLTLGCRSGDGPSFWRVELDGYVQATRVPVPLEAIVEDADPEVERPGDT